MRFPAYLLGGIIIHGVIIIIRPATIDDVPGMATVRVTTWKQAYAGIVPADFLNNLSIERNIEGWRKNLFLQPDPNDVRFVAERDTGQIVGFAIGGAERDGDPEYHAEIYAIYILPEYHRQGIGRQLIQNSVAALKDKGFSNLIIWALTENPNVEFYITLGGKPLRHKQQEIGGKILPETGFVWDTLDILL